MDIPGAKYIRSSSAVDRSKRRRNERDRLHGLHHNVPGGERRLFFGKDLRDHRRISSRAFWKTETLSALTGRDSNLAAILNLTLIKWPLIFISGLKPVTIGLAGVRSGNIYQAIAATGQAIIACLPMLVRSPNWALPGLSSIN